MDAIHHAALGAVTAWYIRPPMWPSQKGQMTLEWKRTAGQRFGLFTQGLMVTIIIGSMGVLAYFTATRSFSDPGDYVIYISKVLMNSFVPYVLIAPTILFAAIIAVTNLEKHYPSLQKGIPDLWRKQPKEHVNAILIPATNKFIGLPFTALLVLMAPLLASYEEMFFREQGVLVNFPVVGSVISVMPELVFIATWSVLIFGLIHLISGVSLAEALVLGLVGGLYFAIVYRYFGGLHASILAHTGYNLVAIGYMVSPDLRKLVSNLFTTAGSMTANND